MKAIVFASLILASTFVGVAAGAPERDSVTRIDTGVDGAPVFYILCANHTTLANCQSPSFWQESNDLARLQPVGVQVNNKHYEQDTQILS